MKKFLLFLMAIVFSSITWGQTTLISPTGDGGFETGATPTLNNWTAVNSSTDGWYIGSVPVVSNGSNCAYISSNAGVAWTYSQFSVIQHLYYDVTIPAGESKISLSFKWKAMGEGTTTSDWDNMKVFFGLSSSIGVPVANTEISSTYKISGAGATSGMYKLSSTSYNTETISLVGTPGSTYRLVFSWKSDGSDIANPPSAIDEVSLTSSLPITPIAPTSFTSTAISNTGMTIGWTDNSTNETAFRVYRSTNDTTYTQVGTDIVSTTTSETGTTYSSVQTGLVPSITYYYRIAAMADAESSYLTGNESTSPPGNITSIASGNWDNIATWSTGVVPTSTDNVTIADGDTVTINTNASCFNLNVGEGNSGILTFDNNTTVKNITINKSVNIAAGGLFDAGLGNKTNTIYIGGSAATTNNGTSTGSLTVNGSLDFYLGSTSGKGTITFFGNQDATISGSGYLCDFNSIVVNKGNTTATTLVTPPVIEFLRDFTVQGANTVGLITTHTAGTVKFGGTFTLSTPLYTAVGYTVPSIGGLWIANPNFSSVAQTGSPTISGLLKITNGIYNVGTASGNSIGLGSNSDIVIEGGTINVAGRFAVSSASNIVNFIQTGGTVNACMHTNASTTYYSFDMGTSTSTNFTMSGGTINIIKGSGATWIGTYDYRGPIVTNTNINITGGTLNIGSASTVAACTYRMLGIAPNTTLDATNNPNLTLAGNTQIRGDLTINGTGIFSPSTLYNLDMRGNSVTNSGNIINNGTLTLNAGSTQSLTFSSSFGNQTLTNNGTITANTLPSLIINNTFTGGTVTLPDNFIISNGSAISATLTLTNGILSANNLTFGNGGTAGFNLINTAGSLAQTPTYNFGTGAVNYTYNGTLAQQTIGNEIPSTITGTLLINNSNGVVLGKSLNVDALTLTNGELTTTGYNLTVTGTTAAKVTRTNGYVKGALIRRLPVSLASGSTFLYPLGKTSTTYRPLELVNPVTNATGAVDIKAEVFDANCNGSIGTNMASLNTNRYWSLEFTNGDFTSIDSVRVRLTESDMDATYGIGKSTTSNGAYDLVSSNQPSSGTITSNKLTSFDYFVVGVKSVPMTVTSTTTTQTVTTNVYENGIDQQIIGIQVVASGNASPISVTNFDLNINGTTSLSDITNAKIYYTGTTNTFATTNLFGSASPANTFSITGSQQLSEGTHYFWLTYDISSTPTAENFIDAECTNITIGGNPNTPTVTAPTGNRQIKSRFIGTVLVGTGQTYTSLTSAGGLFEAINTHGLKGDVTVNIVSDLTETGANALNQWYEAGTGSYTLKIEPSEAVNKTISGSYAGGLIRLNGADRVTVDGNFTGSGQYLTFQNNSTSGSAVIMLSSLGTDAGATYNTIKNCNIKAGALTSGIYGIAVGGATIGSSGDNNDNLTIENNNISKAYNGIYISASNTGVNDTLIINNNTIGSNSASDFIIAKGIYISGANNPLLKQNEIFNLITNVSVTNVGIEISSNVSNAIISRNKIHDIQSNSSSGYGAYGINISSSTNVSNIEIINNLIYSINTINYSTSSTIYNPFGIRISGGTGHKIYYNTVHLFGNQFASGSTGTLSSSLLITSADVTGLDTRNNIFANGIVGSSGSNSYSIYGISGVTFGTINNNNYYTYGIYGTKIGYLGSDKTTINDWKTATTQDFASLNVDPAFTSTTDLTSHSGFLSAAGVDIPSITIDYNGVTRSNPSDIGAINIPGCSGAIGGTVAVSGSSIFCGTSTPVITASGFSSGSGSTYKWQYSNDNFVSDINDFVGQINPYSFNTGLVSTSTYYRLKVNCSSGTATDYSNAVLITINPVPSVVVTPTTAGYCVTGSQLLTASGADTYTWSPSTGLSDTTIAIVTASPSVTTTYTVIGTSTANGCTKAATATISVNPYPTAVTITPATGDVCEGSVQTLVASGGTIGGSGTIGAGTTSNTTTTPYKGYWGGSKSQYLFTASELTAMGLSSSTPINTISFSISAFTGPYTFLNFNIGMKNTSSTVLTSTIETGVSNVLSPSDYTLSGTAPFVVSHTLTSPFNWDGISNLLVEVCFVNADGGGSSVNSANVVSTTTSTNMVCYYSNDTETSVCSAPGSASTSTNRPNVTFTYSTPTNITWSPVTDLYSDVDATTAYTGTANSTVYYKPTGNRTYTATATSAASCSSSNTATLTYTPAVNAGTVTGGTNVCIGSPSPLLTLGTHGGTIINWQSSTDGNTWTDITPTVTTDIYTPDVLTETTQFRAVVQTGICNYYSVSTTVTVNPLTVAGAVTGGTTICTGNTSAELSLTGNTGAITKWQSSLNGTSWTDITPNVTTATYTSGILNSTTYFRAVIQSGVCAELYSDSTIVTVDFAPVAGSVTGGTTICNGSTSGLLTLGGYTGTINRWQSSLNGTDWNDITPNVATDTYTSGALSATTHFRAVVQNGVCPETNSVATTVNVDPTTVAGTLNSDASVCTGSNSTDLTLTGYIGNIVKWQYSLNGTSWTDMLITSNTFTATNLTATTYYRVIVKSGVCNEETSNVVIITVNPIPVPTISGLTTICVGTTGVVYTTEAGMSNYVWSVPTGGTITAGGTSTSNTVTVTWNTTGNHTVVVNYTNTNSCTAISSTVYNITVDPTNIGGTLNSNTNVCSIVNSTPLSLIGNTGSILRWESSLNGTNWTTISNTFDTYTATNVSVTTQYRVVIQSGVCSPAYSTIATITVNTPPVVTITGYNNPSACAATDGNATVSDALSYSWSTNPVQTTKTATGLGSGTYYVTVSDGICTNTASVTLSDPSAPTVTIVSDDTTICTGTSVTFTANGADTYQFFVNGNSQGAASTTNTFTSSTLTNGNSVTVTGILAGCTGNSSGITMIVDPVSNGGNLSGTATICSGSSTDLTLNSYIGTIKRWESSIDGSNWNPISNTVNTYTASGLTATTQYRAVVQSGVCTEVYSNTAIVTVRPTPTATISGTTTVCQNATAPDITFTNPQTLPVTITYNLNGVNETTINVGASTTATIAAPTTIGGTYTYNLVSIVYQSAPTCSNNITGSATVTVRPTPTATISGTTTVCQNATAPDITFNNPQTLPVTITYNVNGGTNTTINVGASTTATVTAPTTNSGTYTYNLVSIAYQSAPTCSNNITGSAIVTVRPTPTATISGTTTLCQNATAPDITFTNPQTLPVTITYNVNGGTNTTINVGASTTATVAAPTTTGGNYAYNLVSVVYQSAPTCSNTITGVATITVTPTVTIAAFSPATSIRCQGAGTITTTTTATNNSSAIVYSLDAPSISGGNTINPATGAVTYSATWSGITTITATASGCNGPATTTHIVTVTTMPTANISYTGSPFCKSVVTPQNITLTGTGAYTSGIYSVSPATGLSISASGAITPSISTTGLYTVTYTIPAAGGCPLVTTNTQATITALPTASISYNGPYCKSVTTPQAVSLNGTGAYTGGTYSVSPVTGLTIDAAGAITPSTSTAGTYTVTYSTPASGGCGVVTTNTQVTINAIPSATISYTGSPFCKTLTTPQTVTLTGTTGGIYSSTAGLYINSATGAITPSLSNAGTYTVTYTIAAAGGCSVVTTTTQVTITALPTATIAYNGPFCTSLATPQTVILTGTGAYTGGTYSVSPATGLTINASGAITPSTSTAGLYTVTYSTPASGGCAVVSTPTQVTITALPTASISYNGPFCTSLTTPQTVTLTGTGAYTGGTYSSTNGLIINASTGAITPSTSTAGTYTVTYSTPASGGCGVVTTTSQVTITALPTASISYSGSPFCKTLTTPQAVTLTGTGAYTGGTYSVSPATGLTIDASGAITPSTSTAGLYTVTYSTLASGGCAVVSTPTQVTITALPTASISYNGSPFCKTLTAPQSVTLSGTGSYTGGTYSVSPATGLTINASGAITPSTSTAGTYTVTYSTPASGGCGVVTTTSQVTITALPTASISYTGSPFCKTLTTPQSVTFSGTTGGIYSSTNGLYISASTGAITPSLSNAGTYTVTYTVAGAGGCGVVTATTQVTITALQTASISYSGSPFCKSIVTPQSVTLIGTGSYTGGSYVSTVGLDINLSTGDINPSNSTAGTYTVTYTTPSSGGCGVVTATTQVTITAIPTATISYTGSPFCSNVSTPQDVTFNGTAGGTFSSTNGLTINPNNGAITPSTSTAGTYTVTYTIAAAGGCSVVTTTTQVTINTLPTAAISYTGTPFCKSITTPQPVSLIGTTGGSYVSTVGLDINLSTGDINPSNSTAGIYEVVYTINAAGGCSTVTASTYVIINPLPAAAGTITGSDTVGQGYYNVEFSVPTIADATSYIWSYSGTGVTINGNTKDITINFTTNATNGNLTVIGRNDCGDGIISAIYPIYVSPVGIVEIGSSLNYQIYPNPTKGIITINISDLSSNLDIQIVNVQGKVLHIEKIINDKKSHIQEIDLSMYPKGIYFVKLINGTNTKVEKVVLQ